MSSLLFLSTCMIYYFGIICYSECDRSYWALLCIRQIWPWRQPKEFQSLGSFASVCSVSKRRIIAEIVCWNLKRIKTSHFSVMFFTEASEKFNISTVVCDSFSYRKSNSYGLCLRMHISLGSRNMLVKNRRNQRQIF